ncbi:MAG: Pr6Pr family membrane protein [Clostridia bacterium]
MIKNRTAQIIFQSSFCALAVIGLLASLGLFQINEGFRWDFFVHFTNLSNYFCMVVMFAELIYVIKKANKQESGFCNIWPRLKFIGVVIITITLVVYNFILAPTRPLYLSMRINSILMHLILPIMYIVDWILFYEHRKVKWTAPLLTLIFPLIYIVFIFIRVGIMKAIGEVATDTNFMYPYFFLNVDKLGIGGLIMWLGILLVAFIAVGYLFYFIDRKIKVKVKDHQ